MASGEEREMEIIYDPGKYYNVKCHYFGVNEIYLLECCLDDATTARPTDYTLYAYGFMSKHGASFDVKVPMNGGLRRQDSE